VYEIVVVIIVDAVFFDMDEHVAKSVQVDEEKRPGMMDGYDGISNRPFPDHFVAFIMGIDPANRIIQNHVDNLSRQIPAPNDNAHTLEQDKYGNENKQ